MDVFRKVSSLIRFANHPYTLSDLYTLEKNKNGDDDDKDDDDKDDDEGGDDDDNNDDEDAEMMPLELQGATGTIPRHL